MQNAYRYTSALTWSASASEPPQVHYWGPFLTPQLGRAPQAIFKRVSALLSKNYSRTLRSHTHGGGERGAKRPLRQVEAFLQRMTRVTEGSPKGQKSKGPSCRSLFGVQQNNWPTLHTTSKHKIKQHMSLTQKQEVFSLSFSLFHFFLFWSYSMQSLPVALIMGTCGLKGEIDGVIMPQARFAVLTSLVLAYLPSLLVHQQRGREEKCSTSLS